jgi:hypothetical protein
MTAPTPPVRARSAPLSAERLRADQVLRRCSQSGVGSSLAGPIAGNRTRNYSVDRGLPHYLIEASAWLSCCLNYKPPRRSAILPTCSTHHRPLTRRSFLGHPQPDLIGSTCTFVHVRAVRAGVRARCMHITLAAVSTCGVCGLCGTLPVHAHAGACLRTRTCRRAHTYSCPHSPHTPYTPTAPTYCGHSAAAHPAALPAHTRAFAQSYYQPFYLNKELRENRNIPARSVRVAALPELLLESTARAQKIRRLDPTMGGGGKHNYVSHSFDSRGTRRYQPAPARLSCGDRSHG